MFRVASIHYCVSAATLLNIIGRTAEQVGRYRNRCILAAIDISKGHICRTSVMLSTGDTTLKSVAIRISYCAVCGTGKSSILAPLRERH